MGDVFSIGIEIDPGRSHAEAKALGEAIDKFLPPVKKIRVDVEGREKVGESIGSLKDEVNVLGQLARGRQLDAQALEVENALRRQGIEVTSAERAAIDGLVARRAELRASIQQTEKQEQQEAGVLERLRGPVRAYQTDVETLTRLLQRGQISQHEFNVELGRAQGAFSHASGGGGGGGLLSSLGGALGEGAQAALPVASVAGAAIAAVGGAKEIFDLSNAYAGLQNKLRQVTGSEQDLAKVTDQLFAISNETGVAIDDEASLYQRVVNATSELGLSANQARGFTEQLSKVIATSGANSIEASQAITQLTQGLGRGVLQGQDLKAVLEDVPAIGKIIAEGLGVPFGKLKELGEQGKITGEQIIAAFAKAAPEIDDKFTKRIPTADQALTKLHNTFEQFAGKALEGLGPVLNDLADDVNQIVQEITPLVVEFGKFVVQAGSEDIKALATYIKSTADQLGQMKTQIEAVSGPFGSMLAKASITPGFLVAYNKFGEALRDVGKTQLEVVVDNNSGIQSYLELLNKKKAVEISAAERTKIHLESEADDRNAIIHLTEKGLKLDADWLAMYAQDTADTVQASKEHEKELGNVLEKLTPLKKAQADYDHEVGLLLELFASGKLEAHAFADALADVRAEHQAALDPVGNMVQQIGAEIAALKQEGEGNVQLRKETELLAKAKKDKGNLSADEIDTIHLLSVAYARAYEEHQKATHATTEETSATKKHEQELDQLLDKITAQARAQAELRRVTADLDELVQRHRITQEQAREELAAWHVEYDDVLDPIGSVSRALAAETAELGLNDAARERSSKEREIENQIAGKGVLLTEEERAAIAGLVDSYYDEKDAIDAARKVQTEYERAVKKATEEEANAIVRLQKQGDAWIQQQEKRRRELAKTRDFALGAREGAKEISDSILDVGNTTKDAMKSIFDEANSDLLTFVVGGEVSLRQFALDALKELAKVLEQMAEIELLGHLFPGSQFGSASGALEAGLGKLFGAREGLDYTVPGSGAPDSRLFAARVSPGERILAIPPGSRFDGGGGGGATHVMLAPRIFNVTDHRDVLDAMRSAEGEAVIINAIRRNSSAARSLR